VNGARYVESATNERAMSRFERDDYAILPNKAAKGTPTIYNVDQNTGALILSVWPVPTADFTLKLDIDRAIDTVTDPSLTRIRLVGAYTSPNLTIFRKPSPSTKTDPGFRL